MSILQLIVAIVVIALAFWANNRYIAPGILRIIVNIILIVICVLLVLMVTGLTGSLNTRI